LIEISKVRSERDINAVAVLVWEFFDHLRTRYDERLDDIDGYILSKNVAGELDDFATYFNPPAGEALLARKDGVPVGIVMMRPAANGAAEMNRMYVTDAARGFGVGRQLAQHLISEARALGYSMMILDAWDRHQEALPLYESVGFKRYIDTDLAPKGMVATAIQMRMSL